MRLLTHNFLQSNVKGTEKGYPLGIERGAELSVESSPVNRNLVLKMLNKVDYSALVSITNNLREERQEDIPELPPSLPETLEEETIANYHKVLFDVQLVNGFLVCPDTGRKFPVKDGIPNMILHEDEI
ncbi:Multifunctional methyltransferase subunit TRM112-like protein [Seminavis robusta]|uniref:Multifunctional methyltransferase subunit TRM112-like protein n=1 Tax=Seminavis robusta TaxID=568900 RepID=A0A9N8DM93_9STRA|nr:Multifunctional methyltransferase subunit TRM112-like protein [Seminavis robusta]|eukprot:Sro236_g095100.1 Multifunctional methyltransferase subunit TRM112-like protein (128) ;mRNA; f:71782-72302